LATHIQITEIRRFFVYMPPVGDRI